MGRIPESLVEYMELHPIFTDATSWELLRKWSLSEVWRVSVTGDDSLIIKKGEGKNSREVTVYKDLLNPLGLDVPTIYKAYMDNVIGILVMKDFKGETLEYNPQFDDFVEAAKTLSKIRNNARSAIKKGKLTNEKYLTHYVSKDNVTNDLMYLSQQDKYVDSAKKTFLNKALDVLPYHVSQLYKNFPLTLTHNDYHLKNLLRINEGIAVIDWASAYLSPHLGDLYCLIHEAKNYNISPADLIYAYSEEMDDSLSNDIEWQINMGGICWTIHVLRQLFDYGIEAIPVAREWVPELISDIHILMDDL